MSLQAGNVSASGSQIAFYNFNNLTGIDNARPGGNGQFANLNGQDNWTENDFSFGAPSAPNMGVTATLSWDGTQSIMYDQSCPGCGGDISRLNDANFSLPQFTGMEQKAYVQVDFRTNFWGESFGLGYDQNGDGKVRSIKWVGNYHADPSFPSEIGPQVGVSPRAGSGVWVTKAGNAGDAGRVPISSVGFSTDSSDDGSGGGWVSLRLVMDFTANGGQGSGSLYYRNTLGHTTFQPVPGMQNLNLGLDPNASDGRNPTLWNAMWSHMEGRPGQLDNVVVFKSATHVPPVVSAGPDVTINEGDTYSGSGSGSFTSADLREVYGNTFEDGAGAEWSNTTTNTTPSGRKFLGRFGNGGTTLNLSSLPWHSEVTVAFDLYIIASWDGTGYCCGPDVWQLGVSGGQNLITTSFTNNNPPFTQAYPGSQPGSYYPPRTGAAESQTLGYGQDTVYRLSFTFAHAASSIGLVFSGSGLEDIANESWGLDNVAVSVKPSPLASVNYGEGAGPQPLPLSGKTFSLSNLYEQDGVYNVQVCVNDGAATG